MSRTKKSQRRSWKHIHHIITPSILIPLNWLYLDISYICVYSEFIPLCAGPWKVNRPLINFRINNRCHHQCLSYQKLCLHHNLIKSSLIRVELETKGSKERTFSIFAHHPSIHLLQKCIPRLHAFPRRLEMNWAKGIGLLRYSSFVVMISGKRIESCQLHPSRAEVVFSVLVKSTNIWADHLNSKDLK